MANYEIRLTTSVQRTLRKLPDSVAESLEAALLVLETEPRPAGCKKLRGRDAYRIRVGDYRIIYEIHDKQLLILVLDAGHRRDIYD